MTEVASYGHRDYETACDHIERCSKYIFAADATSLKEYLELHGVDPLYRNWIRMTLSKLASVDLFARVYLFRGTSSYLTAALSDYFSWSTLIPLCLRQEHHDQDRITEHMKTIKEHLQETKESPLGSNLFLCNVDIIDEFFGELDSFEDFIDDCFEEFLCDTVYPCPLEEQHTASFAMRYLYDSATFLKVLEEYRNHQIGYYHKLENDEDVARLGNTGEKLKADREALESCSVAEFFCRTFMIKDFLITENLIYDYLNPRARLSRNVVTALLIESGHEKFGMFNELFLFTHFILRRVFSTPVSDAEVIELMHDTDKALGQLSEGIREGLEL